MGNILNLFKPMRFNFGAASHGHSDKGHGDSNAHHHEAPKDYHPKRFDKVSLNREVGPEEREE
jgi:hypothetical protein